MKILVLNCGSSSLKYQLIEMDGEKVMAKGLVERIGIEGSRIKHTKTGMDAVTREAPFPTHTAAIKYVLDILVDPEYGVLKDLDELYATGHRIVHGGEKFTKSVLVTPDVLKGIEEVIPLAPLHNPANLQGLKAVMEVLPGKPNVVVFDTAFHQTMPPKAYIYGIPYEHYEKNRVRRYGFHGTSHGYVARRAAEILGRDIKDLKIVTCHLGNGSSITAVKDGMSVGTSFGYGTAEGVLMGTRCGDIDPSVMIYLMEQLGTPQKVSDEVHKKGGLLGVSGISSDLRDVEEAAEKGCERARLAWDILVDGVKKYIAGFAAKMGGVDVVVFTAGIGENGITFRKAVCDNMEFMGVKIDAKKNDCRGKETIISAPDSKVTVMVVPTDEEMVIARDTLKCASEAK
ncbi:acetate/propionate family kinase [Synergistes jonesii]|uniref:Acetate kinase n=1 Tax=Synergistes jonesii TaxID=2754 RepID=A0A073IN34_9BACT|nr:acetate kinase [Synergistes jonesii]KEJ91768.1 acetate kinase [Synergistes jonesii]OFB61559.1 acetate kinase [Synergistes jonesii]OFB62135.1 acetate kinase [Synergistes jonesii]OFB65790.1 acetate kinase [Synergistes jonesii]OFB67141.1 acetate kinase [Synergistes jonesii]